MSSNLTATVPITVTLAGTPGPGACQPRDPAQSSPSTALRCRRPVYPSDVSGHRLNCPICGTELQDQQWASRNWIDCPSMHRLAVSPAIWDELTRKQLLLEIREFMAGLPPIPDEAASDDPSPAHDS